ncbi:hypothetical protein COCON_G00101540 [Conger conger]|uniref:C2H2-type domain-containing protein n=1 Tax=Conger conger TaxID=82655 RepID=A0A9Q1DHM6_CONCO|nr:hypothetical protein COCON_G00101540 [Conger conger]
MSSCASFQGQVASIMEVLAKTAVAEITKLVDDVSAALRLEMSRSQRENESLKTKLLLMEGELRAVRGYGEGTPGSSLNISFEVQVCDEFTEALRPKVAGKGSVSAAERVLDERLSAPLTRDDQNLPVDNKEATNDAFHIKFEPVDGEQDWSESLLLREDRLEEDPKSSQSQAEQKISEENTCGQCDGSAPCEASSDTSAEAKSPCRTEGQEEEFICTRCGKTFPDALELKTHKEQHSAGKRFSCSECGKGFTSSSVLEKHKLEEELHMQPCPAGDPEKELQAELKQEPEEQPLTPTLPLLESADWGMELQTVWSKANSLEISLEKNRQCIGSLELVDARLDDDFSPPHYTARRPRSEKGEGSASQQQKQNGRPLYNECSYGLPDEVSAELALAFPWVLQAKSPCRTEGQEEEFICTAVKTRTLN